MSDAEAWREQAEYWEAEAARLRTLNEELNEQLLFWFDSYKTLRAALNKTEATS